MTAAEVKKMVDEIALKHLVATDALSRMMDQLSNLVARPSTAFYLSKQLGIVNEAVGFMLTRFHQVCAAVEKGQIGETLQEGIIRAIEALEQPKLNTPTG